MEAEQKQLELELGGGGGGGGDGGAHEPRGTQVKLAGRWVLRTLEFQAISQVLCRKL